MVKKMKQRPRRIFYDEKTKRYFYLINKKKKYIKLDKDMPAKKIARINIQNILPVPVKRKLSDRYTQRRRTQLQSNKQKREDIQRDSHAQEEVKHNY